MQLILLQDVENVGLRGDVVDVARGYARNFLLPRRLAEEATPARLGELEKRASHRARHEAATTDQASEIQKVLEHAELRFEMKAGPTGSLFGSVTATDIADELWEKHKVRVDRRKIELPQPIKHVGRYAVPVEHLRGRPGRGGDARLARRRRAAARGAGERGAGRRGAASVEEHVEEAVEEVLDEPRAPRSPSSSRTPASRLVRYPQPLWRAVEYRTNFPRRAAFSSTAPSGQPSTMVRTDVLFSLQMATAEQCGEAWIAPLSTR